MPYLTKQSLASRPEGLPTKEKPLRVTQIAWQQEPQRRSCVECLNTTLVLQKTS